MRPSVVKAKLRRNEPALVTCLHFGDPALYEMASLMGFDALWIDMEHHAISVDRAGELMRAARAGASDIIARPGKGEFMRLGRMLEAGAQGIMYPRCESAAEAAEVVKWAKFAPQGARGVDAANVDADYCFAPINTYLRKANDETFLVIQVESEAAVEQVEAIARVPGVDVVMIGQGDFSVLAGVPYQFDHPKVTGAVARVAAAAQSAGIHWGTTSGTPAHSRQLMEQGARFICHGADIVIMKRGFEQIQAEYAPLGFTFDNRLAASAAALQRYP